MQKQPTQLRKLFLHPPTWFGATDARNHALGGVFFNSSGDIFVWQWPLLLALRDRVCSNSNPHGNISINALKLAAHVLQFLLKMPHMALLEHTLDSVESTAAHGWKVHGSITRNNVVVVLLAWKALQICASVNTSSTAYVPGPLNRLADDALRVLHPTPNNLVAFFNSKYPQQSSWQHAPLTSALKYTLTTVLSGQQWNPESLPVMKN